MNQLYSSACNRLASFYSTTSPNSEKSSSLPALQCNTICNFNMIVLFYNGTDLVKKRHIMLIVYHFIKATSQYDYCITNATLYIVIYLSKRDSGIKYKSASSIILIYIIKVVKDIKIINRWINIIQPCVITIARKTLCLTLYKSA